LLPDFLFSASGFEKYIVRVFELVFPFLLHPVETPARNREVFLSTRHSRLRECAQVDFADVQIFGSEKSEILKSFQAQQRGMESTIEVKDSFVNVEFLNLRSPGGGRS
jgi:hypothetical protein